MMPRLTHLVFEGNLNIQDTSIRQPGKPFFPALMHLDILTLATAMSNATKVLKTGRFKALQNLTLRLEVREMIGRGLPRLDVDLIPFFEALQISNTTMAPLKALSIQLDRDSAISPLSEFPNFLRLSSLTELVIPGKPIFKAWDDKELSQLVDAFPLLQKLVFLGTTYDLVRKTTFRALIYMARHLPDLRELSTSVNLSHLPAIEDVPDADHDLKNLSLLCTIPEGISADVFASLLSKVFPYLGSFKVTKSMDSPAGNKTFEMDVQKALWASQLELAKQLSSKHNVSFETPGYVPSHSFYILIPTCPF